ncbi:MAG: pyruvate dehydrogenase complex dihydrolipoamide acetyltransferase [Alphaproteobacteria bacterium]|nr:pyruvate dehydrogenase complex dihydrolipoamide acetyltransferase [Alphaproteobacteria bacterium]
MPTKILMPALSPTMTEGNLAKWLVKEGDTVESGDVIAEIETDKATMEVEAVDEGKVAKIIVAEGTEGVPVNELIAILLEEDEDESALEGFEASNDSAAPSAPAQDEEKSQNSSDKKADDDQKAASVPAAPQTSSGKRIFASPLARRMAEQAGLDLSTITGSGPRGRIVKADIEAAQSGKTAATPAATQETAQDKTPSASAAAPATAGGSAASGPDAKQLADSYGMEYEEIPNNNMRKVVAKRLLESKQTVPHFYLTVELQIDKLLKTRSEINKKADGAFKVSVNDFFIKAVATALQSYPAANVSWTDNAILQYKHSDISVAVATPNGLITPIIKKAETKGLRTISEEMKDLATRARAGKLKPEEFQGGSFSVSNLGMFGVQEFDAIINPPQSCILAVGAGTKKPYVDGDDEIQIGTFVQCTLSVDHRSVDGAVGAEYLQHLKRYIEDPLEMLV